MNTKAKCLAKLEIEKETYSIRATAHAIERMETRNIDKFIVGGDIMALGKDRLLEFQDIKDKEIALIDEKRDFAMIIAFKGNTLCIITVIDSASIYTLDGTIVRSMKKLNAINETHVW